MNQETADALDAVNRRFYRERASEFSMSRERPWRGWSELFDRYGGLLPASPRVLDLGCGNARFARLLETRRRGAFTYCGVDRSSLALGKARRRIGSRTDAVLVEHDFLRAEAVLPPSHDDEKFDLVVLFGVLHHVPCQRNRAQLLKRASERSAPGGLLVFALWQFERHERFRRKLVPWDRFLRETGTSLDRGELEPGDHVMTWGGGADAAFRYCHATSEEEEEELVRAAGSPLLGAFEVEGEPNRYFVLRQLPIA